MPFFIGAAITACQEYVYEIFHIINWAAMMVLEGWYFECGPVFEEYKLTKKQLDGTLKKYKIGL
jgi:hypothetical protein